MEFVPDVSAKAIQLWNEGTFLATKMNGRRISLYRHNRKYYVIYYTKENLLEKIAQVDKETATKIFNNF
ncbi:MAG TPA: hypothetical protein VGO09_00580 [Flavisolibacter sp.]|nr:hypothetical protein [Flavisolibacter sp.]